MLGKNEAGADRTVSNVTVTFLKLGGEDYETDTVKKQLAIFLNILYTVIY